ncbi:MLO-like protein 13 [Corylus avellana]|uniref:MLO-like protein 13 n=1 Tax=Corylus avellana TaxID=13451 RepID=UPI001E215CA5|nr:MLO-like protein 13 [Corylus avellana]
MEAERSSSLEFTPTWIVAIVCFIIVFLSFSAERGLHRLGKLLEHKDQYQLYQALQKLKEELMLLGFISLLLTVFQGLISRICVPSHLTSSMLPCKRDTGSEHYSHLNTNNRRRLLSEEANSGQCLREGKVPLLSLEALHQLHIFIFVLAVVHVIFCVTTMFLGGARIRQWKLWEDSISKSVKGPTRSNSTPAPDYHEIFKLRASGYWRQAAIVSWMISFFKQFYGSITKSDYVVLRQAFIKEHFPRKPEYNFHKYMVRTLEVDFKKVVSISWYLWLFVVVFLLLNVAGWNSYFWLSFLPLILLLFVGAKLENVISRLAREVLEKNVHDHEAQQVTERKRDHEAARLKPSDEHFWFGRPAIVLYLIQFILFQNSFEIAFFFWILSTYGFKSCIIEKLGFIVTRLIMGAVVQVLCSYSTLPLYALVTQVGSRLKEGIFEETTGTSVRIWAKRSGGKRKERAESRPAEASQTQINKMATESPQNTQISEQAMVAIEETTTTVASELPSAYVAQPPFPAS